ncbi:MAG: TolC family protein [Vicinamibacteria bacterium]
MPPFPALEAEEWMTKFFKTAGTLVAMSLCPMAIAAQERLTLLEAVNRSLSHYPSLRASLAQVDAAAAAVDEAEAARFPTVSVGGSLTRYQEPTIVHPIHAFTPDLVPPFDRTLFQLLADLDYSLFDGGARRSRIDESRARARGQESSFADVRQRLLSQVVQEYLRALSRSSTLSAQDRSIDALELELSRVKQLFDVGRAATVDVLRVEAAIAASRAERVRVLSSLKLAERNLARLIGADESETRASSLAPVELSDRRVPPREEIRQKALESNPTVRLAREELDIAEASLGVSRSRRLPTVNVDGRYVNYGSASGANSLEWNVGVSLHYPVFTGGAVASAVARSQATARSARERLAWMESEVASDVDRAFSTLEETEARVESLAIAVNRFAEVSRIEKLRLDTGVGTEADYIRAEADRLGTEAGLIEAQYAEIAARAELARITGSLGPEWVEDRLRSGR